MKKGFLLALLSVLFGTALRAEDGYRLWLRYVPVADALRAQQYRSQVQGFCFYGQSATIEAAMKEMSMAIEGLLGKKISNSKNISTGFIVAGSAGNKEITALVPAKDLAATGSEGFLIRTMQQGNKKILVIAANTDIGVLYGTFHFLRLLQTGQTISALNIVSAPAIHLRILDHWDNLNRTVERGYAGLSIWNWHTLPDYIDQRYIDYARANASIGINGTVLTNVNANALVLTKDYLVKVAALANVLRPYGIRVYLTARFSAPAETGGLKTADPLDPAVQHWWQEKVKEIYQYIPDFGGFLVKANSEGQPGPQNYGRSHADGANMLADAVAPFGGIVMWRAFVYSNEAPDDRFKQAYNEFQPLDGKFRDNVLIQVKNGPIDFQPREPFHPLFGAMPHTPLMMEFQITQEYLGQATHLVYEAPLFHECLDAHTYRPNANSTVASVVDGSAESHVLSGMAGVANIGNERNWTGHPFGQANWYAFGRLAWDHTLSSGTIAEEWIRQTFSNNQIVVARTKEMMLSSREAMVNYMTPLGLHHIMGYGHHYGPAPWFNKASRADWNPVYFHRADSLGIGFDRTNTGSDALAQYAPAVRKMFGDRATCPEAYLLWFHHVGWRDVLPSGKTLWNELVDRYYAGVDSVRKLQLEWRTLQGLIDEERYKQVSMLLAIQEKEAVWWRNACLLYFQTFSHLPIPPSYEKPDHTLEYYEALKFPYAPGNG
jgi:alpha-glucuronidase